METISRSVPALQDKVRQLVGNQTEDHNRRVYASRFKNETFPPLTIQQVSD